MKHGRIAKVVAGIMVTSAAVGALAGVATAGVLIGVLEGIGAVLREGEVYRFAATVGAGCGLVLGPLASFGFLRRVPLGRLFLETALGTIAAGVAGIMLLPVGMIGGLTVATAGFAAAGARLAWVYRGHDGQRPVLAAGDD